MSQELSTTSYALLGLLSFDAETSEHGLTGYELKQRADMTMRYYWVSPAMSQIYSELTRLSKQALVDAEETREGRRTTRRFRVTPSGREALSKWLTDDDPDFPTLKHPVALRLMMGDLMGAEQARSMLEGYQDKLSRRRADLQAVRDSLGDRRETAYAALVAEWGLAYYESEVSIVDATLHKLEGLDGLRDEP